MPAGYFVVLPATVRGNATVVAQAADVTLTASDMSKIHTNTGAGASKAWTLPAASACAGCAIKVQITAAQPVFLTPISTDGVFLGGSGVASKTCTIAGVIGNYADLYSDGVDWIIVNYSGVLTKAA